MSWSRPFNLETYMSRLREQVNAALSAWHTQLQGPDKLTQAMGYAVLEGGKRIRPVLCLASAEVSGGRGALDEAMPAACAVELIHAYSLIHDDLPSMDDDELRRGKPTVHVAYGEATAILAGDALQAEAFATLARHGSKGGAIPAMQELARAAGPDGMVGGQELDLAAEGRTVTADELEGLARRKTGALIEASCVMGALMAGAPQDHVQALRTYGRGIGLAFQVCDDLLDAEGTTQTVGKKTGKDQGRGKATFPSLLGIDGARARAQELVSQATEALAPLGDRGVALVSLADFVVGRTR
jgi:geranylgeranyl diphosphate synthase type II